MTEPISAALEVDQRESADAVFQRAFETPQWVPEDLRELHREMVSRMIAESRAVPVTTASVTALATVASLYVQYLAHSRTGAITASDLEKMMSVYLRALDTFNKAVQASEAKSRTNIITAISSLLRDKIIKPVAEKDPALARDLMRTLQEELAALEV